MKRTVYSLMASVALCFGFAMTSCGSDDNDGPSLPTPEYEDSSAKYEITTSGSPYSSIELTASGNYIVTASNYSPYAASASEAVSAVKPTLFRPPYKSRASRAYFDGIYYGTYTKTGENQYNLSGFGSITVNTEGDNAYSLTVTTSAGSQTLSASRAVEDKDSSKTNALCRTWNFAKVGVRLYVNGSKKFDKVVPVDKLDELFDAIEDAGGDPEDFVDDYMPEKVIFTKSGTYMVLYKDNTLDISSWVWDNESKGILRYGWDLDDVDSEDDGGLVKISFSGNSMTVVETYEDVEDGIRIKEEFITVLNAAK